jgi:hypothetical protein
MTNKEILYYFEQALKDWERPRWKRKLFGHKNTEAGLCYYFTHKMGSLRCRIDELSLRWEKYKTKDDGFYDFNTREERILAIRGVINDIKLEENKKKRSATDWLFQKLWDTPKDKLNWYALLKQAKEMEEEQHFQTWKGGMECVEEGGKSFVVYYREVFKQ